MLRIGVLGYGYWGPNIVRNFNAAGGATVAAVCDKNQQTYATLAKTNPGIRCTSNPKEIIKAKDIDAVAIVTPVSTHYDLARQALLNGKHVFVEKPFTATVAHAETLVETAEKRKLTIMVDHTFLFTGAVRKIKSLIDEKVLGKIYYYDSTRVNLGLFQHDVNVVWDLAPHDFSIMNYVIKDRPVAVSACGKNHVSNFENIAYITVFFASDLIAHFNVNWLSPVKVRTTLIGGKKKMLVWNDVDPDEKIKVYDRGIEVKNRESIYNLLVNYRSGDMWAPNVGQTEALKLESNYFVECVTKRKTPCNDGVAGLQVVRLLTACDKSLKQNGKMIAL
ncbi:MAG TPA: Gfo/Idh/MocA family oxidoreductase [Chitinivibrionales bacterium]|nr:Gfo/Idh/MocA family oxidoreductase [Chitinivibrionales bacterium]